MTEILDDVQAGEKKRHGCVTAWLIFMIIANAGTALVYLFARELIMDNLPGVSDSPIFMILLSVLGIANVIFAMMLLKWKKIGFFGFIGSSIGAIIVNVSMGLDIVQSVSGLFGIALLYAILQIKENGVSAWDNME